MSIRNLRDPFIRWGNKEMDIRTAIWAMFRVASVAPFLVTAGNAMAEDPFASMDQNSLLHDELKLNGFPKPGVESTTGQKKPLHLEARLTAKGAVMRYGLVWRIFKPIVGPDGKLPLLVTAEGGSTTFELKPGEYFVHVAFGRAGATKKVLIPFNGDVAPQSLVLDAGGMILNAVSGADMRIPPKDLTFNIYSNDVNENGERSLIMGDVKPEEVVRLNAGTYHVVSTYGDVNAVIKADIQVTAGKLTEATIQHKAAQITLKLVSQQGGEAIADTAWSIIAGSGDSVAESVGAFPVIVLSEGTYTAIARHKDKIYQRDFTVSAGHNQDVEVLLTE